MRIAYDNFIDDLAGTALTALTENAAYPLTNLQDQRLAVPYRSVNATSQTVTINLGSAMAVNTLAILEHNFTSSATVVVKANTTDSWGSPATSQTLTWNAGAILKFFTAETYQWWQFQISDPTNPDGYLEMGRIWIGDYITIDPSSLLDFKVTKKRNDNVVHGRGRQKFASAGIGWRQFDLAFPPSNNNLINTIMDFHDAVGTHSSFIFCNFDTIRDYEIVEPCYCSLSKELVFKHTTNMRFNYDLVLEEEK